MSVKRYYWMKMTDATPEMAAVWKSKFNEAAGTTLPAATPYLTKLQAQGYHIREDVTGQTAAQLAVNAELSASEAAAVLAYLAANP